MAKPPKAAKLTAAERQIATGIKKRLRTINITRHLDFHLADASRGRVVITMRVTAKHLQAHKVVHGGILAALADSAGGLATYMAIAPGMRCATVEMKINFLEAVAKGKVTAVAEVVRIGRHLSVVDCDITDDSGRLVCKALMTFFVGAFPKS